MPVTAARPLRPILGTIRRPRRGLAALRGVQGFRRATQLAFALAVVAVVVDRSTGASPGGGQGGSGSGEALCPFGGIESAWTFVTTGGLVPHVHLSNIVLAVAFLLVAFLARGGFCGWICPLGFLQDLVTGVSRLAQRRSSPIRRAVQGLRRRAAPLVVLDRPLRLLKYVILAWALAGTAAFGVMVFRDIDPWIALLEIGRETIGFGPVVLGVLLVAALFVPRPWCRYACPLGAVNGLVARFGPIRLERAEAACAACSVCSTACPMGLPVATATRITSVDCNGCLECVEACPRVGALELRAGLPVLSGR